jgi:hypothetical protein
MKKIVLMACAGMACCSVALGAPPVPQTAKPVKVDPIKLATVRRVDGQIVRTSEWIPYTGNSTRETGTLAFDSFQTDDSHAPVGGTECGLPGDGYRWYGGADYQSLATAEDMMFDGSQFSGGTINEYSLAWAYQPQEAYPTPDISFVILVFCYEEMIDNTDCSQTSVGVFPDDFTPVTDGVIANYGQLPLGFWYSNIAPLNDLGMLFPADSDGTYEQIFLWIDETDNQLYLPPAWMNQFLWGTADDGGIPGRPGTNDIQAYIDDNAADVVYDAVECYSLLVALCPDPLANMGMFYVKGGTPCTGSADYDGDTFLTGVDFDLFVQDFELGCVGVGDPDPACTGSADHNGNGFVEGEDYDSFVRDFEAGCI